MRKTVCNTISPSARVRSAMRVTLLAASLALVGCTSSDGSGGRHAGAGPLPPTNAPIARTAHGPLEGALGNAGGAVDDVADLGLESSLGGLGKQLDGPLAPVYGTLESTTQSLGAQTGLGVPADSVLKQLGGVVAGVGDKLDGAGLPGGLGEGTGTLATGVGNAVAAAGGLLNQSPDNSDPSARTLADATGGVRGLASGLASEGGLLEPLAGALGDGPDGQPIVQPALSNAGQAGDQVLPLGLQPPLGSVGHTLDKAVSPASAAVTQVTQTVGGSIGMGMPVNQLLTSIGGNLGQAAGGADAAIPLGLNGVIDNLGAAVSSVGGLVHRTQGNANPLGSTLDHATQAVVSLAGGVDAGGGQGGGFLDGALGGDLLGGGGGVLGPMAGQLGGLGGALGGDVAGGDSARPLASLTGALGGDLLGIGGGEQGSGGGLLGGLLGGLGGR